MIELKSNREIQLIREAGEIAQKVFKAVQPRVVEGVTTDELDGVAEKIIRENGGQPAFKGYRGFPKTACISVNEEVVHGIPDARRLQEGDIVSFDIGVKFKGFFADAARTWHVGRVGQKDKDLIRIAKEAFDRGLDGYKPGWRIGDLSETIQKYIESQGYQVVRDYAGHGIGRELHEDPQVPNYGKPGRGAKLEPGLVLAIEPMVTAGHYAVETLANGWTVVTKDGKNASHYEDTVAFTENGIINLTGDEAS
ncbi:MAG TPA: type I methionyl aminopeptidase [Candidatus Omnitrophota bacterium]|nr:type I methionyl aminopeptidase [Candidatus Omnitrophota bacterium]HPS36169.1 type I methionyl aminopeptidase [Candidatus Omnitrophota bacterium]